MNRKWGFFVCAVVLAGYLLLSQGVPLLPMLAGVGLAAILTLRKSQLI
jgi:hypothetical protein